MTKQILVVDDEADLLELVRVNLVQAGYSVDLASNGSEALDRLRRSKPDLVILDLMLPDTSGTEICRQIRADPNLAETPVIMLTALSQELDRVVGFELGADDYVTKPFSPRELVLRVKAVLRRRDRSEPAEQVLRHDNLTLDMARRRCFLNDELIELTAKEFGLLETLMKRSGHVFTRERLLDLVWGSDVAVTLRTIDTHVKRLREKLGEAGDLIDTVRGVGYRFSDTG
ncbi:MAG: response regulator transcription factor [Deltaproteobacteria bacterium]|nr:response regulator transcription factor [Deltaproteobacteria bacterium]MBW2295210.1 response regulator transcription factor [Deltaproteobacteria bacterium]